MDEQHQHNAPDRPRRSRGVALAVATAALAIPAGALVSGALADDGSTATTQTPQTLQVQQQGSDPAPAQDHRRPCPERDGGAGGGSGSAAPQTPSNPDTSAQT